MIGNIGTTVKDLLGLEGKFLVYIEGDLKKRVFNVYHVEGETLSYLEVIDSIVLAYGTYVLRTEAAEITVPPWDSHYIFPRWDNERLKRLDPRDYNIIRDVETSTILEIISIL